MKRMMTRLGEEIQRLEAMSKSGASYTDSTGSYGWRNPIREDTGPLLSAQVAAHAPQRILEVGTAHGLSALHLISGWTDFEGKELHTIERDGPVGAHARACFDGLGLPVTVHIGEAMQVIAEGLSGTFDLVFLDAQKSHYGRQWRSLVERDLVGKGTVLLADNVIDRKEECTDFFAALDGQGTPYEVLPTECGLLVAVVP
jgi:predicted O-methyltransferase YrrM